MTTPLPSVKVRSHGDVLTPTAARTPSPTRRGKVTPSSDPSPLERRAEPWRAEGARIVASDASAPTGPASASPGEFPATRTARRTSPGEPEVRRAQPSRRSILDAVSVLPSGSRRRSRPRLLALVLALSIAAPALAADPTPSSEETDAKPPEATTKPSAGRIAFLVGLGEALILGYSAAAARWPEPTGWTMVAFAPIGIALQEPRDQADRVAGVVFGVGYGALGLYDALELRSTKYGRSERFWLNVGGWHAAIAAAVLTAWITGPPGTEPSKVLWSVGPRAGGSVLLVSGRF
jgi:hypothetical protein